MTLQRRHALWLVIFAAHVGLLALLTPRHPAPADAARQSIRVMLPPLPRVSNPPQARPRVAQAAAPLRRWPQASPATAPATVAEPAPAAEPDVAAVPPPASAEPLLLNSEGTRRAIQLATRAPLLSERAASASQDPGRENAQQRFGREVASTAYGNCLKGEFPGGGGGLLSLPFWIAAEASGKCKK